jgi:hypothetical protein
MRFFVLFQNTNFINFCNYSFSLCRGPAESQVFVPSENVDVEEAYGTIASEDTPHISKVDQLIIDEIYKATGGKITPRTAWPHRSVKPINEYGEDKIFCLTFPWLFPGGIGDVNEPRKMKLNPGEWAKICCTMKMQDMLKTSCGVFCLELCFLTLQPVIHSILCQRFYGQSTLYFGRAQRVYQRWKL